MWSLLVFVPVFKWVYGGWLGQRGSLDFAGGTAIHINAGIAALAAVLVLGKRKGWPGEGHPPHSMPLVMLGTGILWFGWFGFNAGSALAANGTGRPGVREHLPRRRRRRARPGSSSSRSGTATSPTSARPPASSPASSPSRPAPASWPACRRSTSALIAGVVCYFAVGLKTKAGYDDTLDVVGVHFVGGLVGSLLLGFFADPDVLRRRGFEAGVFHDGGTEPARRPGARQRRDRSSTRFIVTTSSCWSLKATIGLRVIEEAEDTGLDLAEHAETAYHHGGTSTDSLVGS